MSYNLLGAIQHPAAYPTIYHVWNVIPVAGLGFGPSPITISEPVLWAQTSSCSLAAALKVSPAAISTYNMRATGIHVTHLLGPIGALTDNTQNIASHFKLEVVFFWDVIVLRTPLEIKNLGRHISLFKDYIRYTNHIDYSYTDYISIQTMLLVKALLTTSYSNTLLKYLLSLNYICSDLEVSSMWNQIQISRHTPDHKIQKKYLDILLLEPMG